MEAKRKLDHLVDSLDNSHPASSMLREHNHEVFNRMDSLKKQSSYRKCLTMDSLKKESLQNTLKKYSPFVQGIDSILSNSVKNKKSQFVNVTERQLSKGKIDIMLMPFKNVL